MRKIIVILFFLPLTAFAGPSGKRQILQVEVTDVFFTVYSAGAEFNKESCDVGNPIAFKRADFPDGYDGMLSTALAAYMGGKEIEMWFVGCQQSPWSGTMPMPSSIVIK